MSYRPALRALGVAALALLLTVAAALPASATATPASVDLPSGMLGAMQRDLGLSAPQAKAQVARESAAATTETALRVALGDSFAGAWLDGAGTLVVGTTDPAQAGTIRAAGAQPTIRSTSAKNLGKVQAKLDRAARRAADTVAGWYVDEATGTVVVTTTNRADAQAFVATAAAATDPVQVRAVTQRPTTLANLVGGNAIYAAVGGRCSIGFSARSSSSTTYVITAGHCTDLGGTWNGYNQVPIGPVAASAFPGDDFGAIRVNSTATWTGTSQVAGTSSVLGSTAAVNGASTCRSGSTTGYRCGTVQGKNETVNYGGGDVVYGLTRTSACAEPGDSGGSFVSGRQAQGMVSGGSGDCTVGGTTYFQPVNEVLSRYGLTLIVG